MPISKRAQKLNGKPGWVLDFGVDPATQKRKRLYFPDEEKCDDKLADCEKKERQAGGGDRA